MSPFKTGFLVSLIFHGALIAAIFVHFDARQIAINNPSVSLNFSQLATTNAQSSNIIERKKREQQYRKPQINHHHKPPERVIIEQPSPVSEAIDITQDDNADESEKVELGEDMNSNNFNDIANAEAGGGAIAMLGENDEIFALIKSIIDKHNEYPKMAYRMGIEGFVIVEFVLFNNGEIGAIRIVNNPHKDLARGAREAIVRAHREFPRLQTHRKIKVKLAYNITY